MEKVFCKRVNTILTSRAPLHSRYTTEQSYHTIPCYPKPYHTIPCYTVCHAMPCFAMPNRTLIYQADNREEVTSDMPARSAINIPPHAGTIKKNTIDQNKKQKTRKASCDLLVLLLSPRQPQPHGGTSTRSHSSSCDNHPPPPPPFHLRLLILLSTDTTVSAGTNEPRTSFWGGMISAPRHHHPLYYPYPPKRRHSDDGLLDFFFKSVFLIEIASNANGSISCSSSARRPMPRFQAPHKTNENFRWCSMYPKSKENTRCFFRYHSKKKTNHSISRASEKQASPPPHGYICPWLHFLIFSKVRKTARGICLFLGSSEEQESQRLYFLLLQRTENTHTSSEDKKSQRL